MKQMITATDTDPATMASRSLSFVAALRAAPGGSDIDVLGGRNEDDGVAVVLVRIEGEDVHHAFTPDEARRLADVFESGLRKFPSDATNALFADVIMALRAAADISERNEQ